MKKDHIDRQYVIWNFTIEDYIDGQYIIRENYNERCHITNTIVA